LNRQLPAQIFILREQRFRGGLWWQPSRLRASDGAGETPAATSSILDSVKELFPCARATEAAMTHP